MMAIQPTKVVTVNAQGLRSVVSRLVFFSWLSCFCPDIVCVQETHSISTSEMHDWVEQHNVCVVPRLQYKCVSSPGSARSVGVAILFMPKFEVQCTKRDDDGRLVVAEFSGNNLLFQVMCLYAPNKDEGKQFFESFIRPLTPTSRC